MRPGLPVCSPCSLLSARSFFRAPPARRNNYFARLFLDAKPSDGLHRIVVRGTDNPRLADKVERMRRSLSPTRFKQEIEVEMLADGASYFDLGIISNATSQESAL